MRFFGLHVPNFFGMPVGKFFVRGWNFSLFILFYLGEGIAMNNYYMSAIWMNKNRAILHCFHH